MAMAKDNNRIDCAEFQARLPQLMESGADLSGEPHLKDCRGCSDLVADLQYIAEQAKLLLPLRDPSPEVWGNIKGTLTREGLMKDDDDGGDAKKKVVQLRH
jgi:hypothetical protein